MAVVTATSRKVSRSPRLPRVCVYICVCVCVCVIITYVILSKKGVQALMEQCIEFGKRLYLLRWCKLGTDAQLCELSYFLTGVWTSLHELAHGCHNSCHIQAYVNVHTTQQRMNYAVEGPAQVEFCGSRIQNTYGRLYIYIYIHIHTHAKESS